MRSVSWLRRDERILKEEDMVSSRGCLRGCFGALRTFLTAQSCFYEGGDGVEDDNLARSLSLATTSSLDSFSGFRRALEHQRGRSLCRPSLCWLSPRLPPHPVDFPPFERLTVSPASCCCLAAPLLLCYARRTLCGGRLRSDCEGAFVFLPFSSRLRLTDPSLSACPSDSLGVLQCPHSQQGAPGHSRRLLPGTIPCFPPSDSSNPLFPVRTSRSPLSGYKQGKRCCRWVRTMRSVSLAPLSIHFPSQN
jgi:hypothetical protein